MKRLTIGRNPNNDIVLDHNMVSRNHALLNVYSANKFEIVNMGANGTKVNGILIANGQPYPLKRGDAVIFAGQCQLDWDLVPKPRNIWLLIALIGGGTVMLALIIWLIIALINLDWTSSDCNERADTATIVANTVPTDSTDITATEVVEAAELESPDETKRPTRNIFFPEKKKTKKNTDDTQPKSSAGQNTSDVKPESKPDTDNDNQTTHSEHNGWHR